MPAAPRAPGADGELIPLDEQDRTLWDRAQIAEGVALLAAALSKGAVGAYQLQAAIAAVHDEAAARRGHRLAADPRPLRSARAHVRQPDGRAQSRHRRRDGARPARRPRAPGRARRDARLAGHHRLDAVRAHLLELAGDRDAAVDHYRAPPPHTPSIPERNYLLAQVARLSNF